MLSWVVRKIGGAIFPPLIPWIIGIAVLKNTGPILKKVAELGCGAVSTVLERATRKGLLTYRDVMEYFINERPDNQLIAQGGVYKESIENDIGFIVYLLFLDKDNHPVVDGRNVPYGIKCRVAKIDNELMNTFGGNNLIIIRL